MRRPTLGFGLPFLLLFLLAAPAARAGDEAEETPRARAEKLRATFELDWQASATTDSANMVHGRAPGDEYQPCRQRRLTLELRQKTVT